MAYTLSNMFNRFNIIYIYIYVGKLQRVWDRLNFTPEVWEIEFYTLKFGSISKTSPSISLGC